MARRPANSRRGFLTATGSAISLLAGCAAGEPPETGTPSSSTSLGQPTQTQTRDSPSPTKTEGSRDFGEWPTFQYDRRNSGYNPNVAGPKSEITVRWTRETDPGETVRASPTIGDSTVFVGAGKTVYALTLDEGEERWRTTVDGVVDGAPAVSNDAVFVGSKQGTVYRLARRDGSVVWQHPTGFPNQEHRPASPRVAGDRVHFGTANGLLALDATTGERRWHALTREVSSTRARIHSTPAIGEQDVYVGHPMGVYALSRDEGSVRWRTMVPPDADYSTTYVSSPAITDEHLFVGDRNGTLYMIDRDSGDLITRFENEFEPDLPGSPSDEITTSPAVANGTVVAGSEDYHVYAWDMETGERRWRFRVGGRCYTSPAIADGTVYAGGVAGRLFGLDLQSGEVRWEFDVGGQLLDSAPAVVEGLVCVVNHRGDIVMIQGET